MNRITDIPENLQETKRQIVTVSVWETDLLENKNNLLNTLCLYALDKGPIPIDQHPGMLCFRFTDYDWERTLKQLFLDNGIPVMIGEITAYNDFMHVIK